MTMRPRRDAHALPTTAPRPAAALALVLALAAAAAGAERGVTDEAILVGMEGPAGSFSVDEENRGMRLVLHDVNAAGGIHGRRLVERSYPRGGEDPVEQAYRNARRLVEEDGVFLLFNFGGPASVRIGPYAMEKKVPYLFPHTALYTPDGARYVFTSFPRYPGEARVVLRDLAEERGVERLAVVYAPNAYGRLFLERARSLGPGLGLRVVGAEPIAARHPETALPALRALREARPQAILMALYPEQARKVMEAKAELGWREVRMVSSGPLTDERYLDVPGGVAEGTIGFCHYPDPERSDEPGVVEYRRRMAAVFPDAPLTRYSLYGYVFGRLVVEGLRRAGRDLTREGFIDAMESIRDWSSGGILPPVSFSKTDHHAQRAGFLCELRAGRFVPLTGWIEP